MPLDRSATATIRHETFPEQYFENGNKFIKVAALYQSHRRFNQEYQLPQFLAALKQSKRSNGNPCFAFWPADAEGDVEDVWVSAPRR